MSTTFASRRTFSALHFDTGRTREAPSSGISPTVGSIVLDEAGATAADVFPACESKALDPKMSDI